MARQPRLIVISNRLPVRRIRREGKSQWEQSPGGLVTALAPILQDQKGAWIGWAGGTGKAPEPFELAGIQHHPVGLSKAELDTFYYGFANRTLWPLYHDAVRAPAFHRRWWWPYVDVNRRFAAAAAEIARPGDLVWVHDYHLQLAPAMIREMRPDVRIGFYLHIPFPPVELFAHLPWRTQILEGMLGSDVIGFQTSAGARNFAEAARRLTSASGPTGAMHYRGRTIHVREFPISIDVNRFEELATDPSVIAKAQRLRVRMGPSRRVLLGVDRLDYSKGIDARLRAFEELLRSEKVRPDNCVFVQIAVPSREEVDDYVDIRTSVEQIVGRINGEFGEPGQSVVHYLHRSVPQDELVSHYLAADVMVVTPFRDGMNLVAKEFVATRVDNTGVLVLSEFAGAAVELRSALMINPHDLDGMASTIEAALNLPPPAVRKRMKALRKVVKKNDVFHWADHYLEALKP